MSILLAARMASAKVLGLPAMRRNRAPQASRSGDEPGEPALAAAIFLHRFSFVNGVSGATKPTSGCVSLSAADLYDYAFYVMRPRLARVAGAGQVAVASSDTREIEVVVDPARLLTAGLTVHDVAERLRSGTAGAPSHAEASASDGLSRSLHV